MGSGARFGRHYFALRGCQVRILVQLPRVTACFVAELDTQFEV